MLLIHVPRLTNRVGYTLNVIFRHLLKVEFEITTNIDIFTKHEGARVCYGRQKVGDCVYIRSCELLFKTTIEEQSPKCFQYQDVAALFPVYDAASDFPFDPLASTFFCLSRYEEYLPHITDEHGRYPVTESVAFKNNFLQSAVVDRWALMIAHAILKKYPAMKFPSRNFDFEDTFDIDAAYCYKHKGIFRTAVGLGRDLFVEHKRGEVKKRLRVLTGREPDPFDTFDYILDTHNHYPHFRLKFFPLMADYNVYDKPASYQNKEFCALLQHLCDYAKMGLHGSYASHDDPAKLAQESARLASVLHRETVRNRYHFLRLTLPASYNALIENGIIHDYTMGYAEEPGFRAGTGNPYPFFDLDSDSETPLYIHPFVVMDSTLYYYKKIDAEQALQTYYRLIDESKAVGGVFSALWHNQSLCECFGWQGWRNVYEKVLQYADTARDTKYSY